MSDARWELLEPTLTAWRAERRGKGLDIGRPPEHDVRRIMDAILHVDRSGIPWRYLPHGFAPWETVYGYFAAWQKDAVFDQLLHHRRLVRDYETHPHRSEAMTKVALVDLMSRRRTRESTPNWRDA